MQREYTFDNFIHIAIKSGNESMQSEVRRLAVSWGALEGVQGILPGGSEWFVSWSQCWFTGVFSCGNLTSCTLGICALIWMIVLGAGREEVGEGSSALFLMSKILWNLPASWHLHCHEVPLSLAWTGAVTRHASSWSSYLPTQHPRGPELT